MRAWLVLAAALAAGCQFDGGLGEGLLCPTGECPAGQSCVGGVCTVEGAPVDAAGDGEPADAGDPPDGAPLAANLVDNPGMEDGVPPWTPFNATLATTADGHSGAHGLRVCNGSTGDFTVYQDVLKAPVEDIPVGQAYAASIWVRAAPDATIPVRMMLTIRESGGATSRTDHDGPLLDGVGSGWVRLEASGTVVAGDRENLILIVWALESADTACFEVDDADLHAE